jgi:hypothetical protein
MATIGPLFMSVEEVRWERLGSWIGLEGQLTGDQVGEERLGGEVGICGVVSVCRPLQLRKARKPTVLLEVGLAGGDELQGDELEAALGLASVWAGSGRWMFLTRGSRSGQ